jgi:hypothetical protein
MMISATAALDIRSPIRDFDISLTVMDSVDEMDDFRSAAVGWNLPLTMEKQAWKDFLFMFNRGQDSLYVGVLGFYVRYLGDPD